MNYFNKTSEKELLELYQIAFTNTESNPVILQKLERRYDSEQIAVGKNLLQSTTDLYNKSLAEKEKLAAAHAVFSEKRDKLEEIYKLHRKLTLLLLKGQKPEMDQLALSAAYPGKFMVWIPTVRKFYTGLSENPELINKLSGYKITEEEISEGLELVNEVAVAYALYTDLKGESQMTTELKNASFKELNQWMRNFYAIARIAFRDQPQQLESFGIVVKG